MSELYHTEIGFPSNVELPSGTYRLEYSNHAKRASYDDRYGQMTLPTTLDVDDSKLIEIEVENDKVIKCVYRTRYDDTLDLIIVMIPQKSFVKTVWFNRSDDKHSTLQRWKYRRP
jgi:antitoxin component of MazEF toxin-antitoxin module